jgi:hypothetical protein
MFEDLVVASQVLNAARPMARPIETNFVYLSHTNFKNAIEVRETNCKGKILLAQVFFVL